MKPALNASPAPVVSTTRTRTAAERRSRAGSDPPAAARAELDDGVARAGAPVRHGGRGRRRARVERRFLLVQEHEVEGGQRARRSAQSRSRPSFQPKSHDVVTPRAAEAVHDADPAAGRRREEREVHVPRGEAGSGGGEARPEHVVDAVEGDEGAVALRGEGDRKRRRLRRPPQVAHADSLRPQDAAPRRG